MDISQVVAKLKNLLDGNVGLNNLLGTKVGDSKVFIRNTIPQTAQYPMILISDFVHSPQIAGQRPKHYNAAIDVSVCVALNADGSDNLVMLHQIAYLVDGIVEEAFHGTVGNCVYSGFKLQTAAAAQTQDSFTIKVITYQGKLSKV